MMKLKKNMIKRINIKAVTKAALIPALAIAMLVSVLLLTGAGCAGSTQVKTEAEGIGKYIFYPPLPNQPRFQYLKTFTTSLDIEKPKSKIFKFVVGKKDQKPLVIKKAHGADMHEGIIYVCDIKGPAVVTLDLKNRRFGYLGDRGSGKLKKPINLFIDRNEKLLYVADVTRKQVLCYTLDGKIQRFYGKEDQFKRPVDVEVYEDKLFVCDSSRHQVLVLDKKTGETLYAIGEKGAREGQFYYPTNISIHDNRLYVSDGINFRIQVLGLEGKYQTHFGQQGKKPGYFSRNKGIDVDKEGRIYVVDASFDNVQVFDNFEQEFKLLLFMLGPGNEKHNINLPAGVTVVYDNLEYFKDYLAPGFQAEYLLLVTSHFGSSRVNVYAFGNYSK
jgi:hypothetical protein